MEECSVIDIADPYKGTISSYVRWSVISQSNRIFIVISTCVIVHDLLFDSYQHEIQIKQNEV